MGVNTTQVGWLARETLRTWKHYSAVNNMVSNECCNRTSERRQVHCSLILLVGTLLLQERVECLQPQKRSLPHNHTGRIRHCSKGLARRRMTQDGVCNGARKAK